MTVEIPRLYAASTDVLNSPFLFEKAFRKATPYRKEKTERYKFRKDKNLSLGAEMLLFYALKDIGYNKTPEYISGTNGKPYLKDKDIFFNLSHSEEYVLCGISNSEIGCDIQKVGKADLKISERFFTENEHKKILSAENGDKDRMFYRIWTLKESFIKANGKGLNIPLDSFEILPQKIPKVKHTGETELYFKEFSDINGYCCSLCSQRDCLKTELKIIDLRDFLGR